MKLYQNLAQQQSMPVEHKFAYAVLKRLAIIEPCAAMDVAVTSQPSTAVLECCRSQQKATEATRLILEIFADIGLLASLIDQAFRLEAGDLNAKKIKKQGSESMQSILGKFKPYELAGKIETYVTRSSVKILKQLDSKQCLTQLEMIKKTIQECYLCVDSSELDRVLAIMTSHLAALHDGDWVDVQRPTAAANGMFKTNPQVTSAVADTPSICSLS